MITKKYKLELSLTSEEKEALDFFAKSTWHNYWTEYVRNQIYSIFNPNLRSDSEYLKNKIGSIKCDIETNKNVLAQNMRMISLYEAIKNHDNNRKTKIYHDLREKEINRIEEWIKSNLNYQIKLKKRYYKNNKELEQQNKELNRNFYQVNRKLEDISNNYILIPKVLNIHEKWRIDVLTRDKFTCRKCGNPSSSAHHIYSRKYCKEKSPQLEWDTRNGVSLCFNCHNQITIDGRKWFMENKVKQFDEVSFNDY